MFLLDYLLLQYTVFFTPCLSTTSLIFSSLQEQYSPYQHTFKSSTFVFKLIKLVGRLINLLMPSFSTSDLEATKSFYAAKLDVSIPISCSNSI